MRDWPAVRSVSVSNQTPKQKADPEIWIGLGLGIARGIAPQFRVRNPTCCIFDYSPLPSKAEVCSPSRPDIQPSADAVEQALQPQPELEIGP